MIKESPTFSWIDLGIFALVLGLIAWFMTLAVADFHYRWNWQAIPQYLFRQDIDTGRWVPGVLMQGVITTLRLSVWATLLALVLGTVSGLMRTSVRPLLRIMATGYVELIRNIPILVWVFIAYYFVGDRLIPMLGLDHLTRLEPGLGRSFVEFFIAPVSRVPVFISGMAALAVYEAAYITEIVRAGIQSIERGQWEASSALGFSRLQLMQHIILPQAFKKVLPALAGQIISTIKDSAIVSVISIPELTFQGMELMSATFLTFEVWTTILVIYFIGCFACSLAVGRLESYTRM